MNKKIDTKIGFENNIRVFFLLTFKFFISSYSVRSFSTIFEELG